MNRRPPSFWLPAVMILLPAIPSVLAAVPGEDEARAEARNVLVTITVGEAGNDGSASEKSYRLVAWGLSSNRMMTGWRVPIPTTVLHADEASGETAPITSFNYHDVGMAVQLRSSIMSDNRIELRGDIEISALSEDVAAEKGPNAPTLTTLERQFHVVLDDGVPLKLAVVPGPNGGSRYVQFQADLID